MKIVYQGKTKTGKEIIIRYPEIDDVVEMTRYINELSKEKTFITFQGEEITEESEKEYLKGYLKKISEKTAIKLLTIYNYKIIGISDIHLGERTVKHIGIFGITVAREFRNEGVGKLLMEKVFEEAVREMPTLKIVSLEVFAKNSIARRIYQGFGFTEYGLLPNGIMRDNTFEDAILMYKNIK
ncbi:MAG: GNAT family N-acetyltransferase [Patescibacteria group bacterium]|nr:GNAT family N-acetyltransferase [Patescibacteria group bacterium]